MMRCAGAPAAVNDMQLALHKGKDGSYRKLECKDMGVTNFSLEDLASCTIPISNALVLLRPSRSLEKIPLHGALL